MIIYPCPDCDGFTERFRHACHKCVAAFSAEWEPIDRHEPRKRTTRWERFKAWGNRLVPPEFYDIWERDDDEETA